MHAEIGIAEEFIDERLMIGESGILDKIPSYCVLISLFPGYCLSTFQTCLFYIQSLDWREADQQHSDLQK